MSTTQARSNDLNFVIDWSAPLLNEAALSLSKLIREEVAHIYSIFTTRGNRHTDPQRARASRRTTLAANSLLNPPIDASESGGRSNCLMWPPRVDITTCDGKNATPVNRSCESVLTIAGCRSDTSSRRGAGWKFGPADRSAPASASASCPLSLVGRRLRDVCEATEWRRACG